jgi:hypothetical protein
MTMGSGIHVIMIRLVPPQRRVCNVGITDGENL